MNNVYDKVQEEKESAMLRARRKAFQGEEPACGKELDTSQELKEGGSDFRASTQPELGEVGSSWMLRGWQASFGVRILF